MPPPPFSFFFQRKRFQSTVCFAFPFPFFCSVVLSVFIWEGVKSDEDEKERECGRIGGTLVGYLGQHFNPPTAICSVSQRQHNSRTDLNSANNIYYKQLSSREHSVRVVDVSFSLDITTSNTLTNQLLTKKQRTL